jgi:membrane protein
MKLGRKVTYLDEVSLLIGSPPADVRRLHINPMSNTNPEALIPSEPASAMMAEARAPWRLTGRDAKQAFKRIWLMWGFHNLSLLAGGVAFFCFLAITPLIAAIVMLYGLVADVSTVERQGAFQIVHPDRE